MINTINGILEAAKGGKTGVIAVAAAHDQPVIEAVVEARKEGIATPILVGHVDEIKDMLSGLGENPADYEIVAGDSDTDCAAKAVALCAEDLARAGKLVSAQELLPVYLRPPQAQRLRQPPQI